MPRNGIQPKCLPFLKWAGGKRWFVKSFLQLVPEKYNTYIEPFLGSAAMFFALQPSQAVLSDLNLELIKTYRAIKNDWRGVATALARHNWPDRGFLYQVK